MPGCAHQATSRVQGTARISNELSNIHVISATRSTVWLPPNCWTIDFTILNIFLHGVDTPLMGAAYAVARIPLLEVQYDGKEAEFPGWL
jgi:hypothetical protein